MLYDIVFYFFVHPVRLSLVFYEKLLDLTWCCLSHCCQYFFAKLYVFTHTHNHFTALLEFVRPGEQVPER